MERKENKEIGGKCTLANNIEKNIHLKVSATLYAQEINNNFDNNNRCSIYQALSLALY